MARLVPLSRFTSQVGGGSAFYVRHHSHFMKYHTPLITAALFVSLISGCSKHPSSNRSTTEKLTGAWQADVSTQSVPVSYTEQRLNEDGTFEMRGNASKPTKQVTFVIYGTWRVPDSDYLCLTITNGEPDLGFQHDEMVFTLTSVTASKYSMRTPEGTVITFRKTK